MRFTREQAGPVRRVAQAILACVSIAGCTMPSLPPSQAEVEANTAFVTVPARQAWVDPGDEVLVMQRGLVNGSEQRIALPNRTSVQGDNFILIRTRKALGPALSFQYEDFIRRIGGLPAPFQKIRSGDFTTDEDGLGPYFWVEERAGANTICVLAIRRLDNTVRQLPPNVDAMDILLRNCVTGSREDALRPIQAESLGTAQAFAPRNSGSRMISPLAGPTPR